MSEVGGLRGQRTRLREAMMQLEGAVAAPLTGRAERWRTGTAAGLAELQSAWQRHLEATEGEGDLFEQIRTDAPHLDPLVRRLHRDHAEIGPRIDDLLAVLGVDDQTDDVTDHLAAAREEVTKLLGRLARHRQQGADLVYQAYSVDLGGHE